MSQIDGWKQWASLPPFFNNRGDAVLKLVNIRQTLVWYLSLLFTSMNLWEMVCMKRDFWIDPPITKQLRQILFNLYYSNDYILVKMIIQKHKSFKHIAIDNIVVELVSPALSTHVSIGTKAARQQQHPKTRYAMWKLKHALNRMCTTLTFRLFFIAEW